MAGARHHPPRDPGILPLAPSPDVLRGLPGPPAGQVRAFGQGAAGRGLHELERPRLLLQIRPHRREVRADRGAGQVPGREEAGRNARVQGLAGVGGRGRQRPLLRRGPGAGPEGAPGRGALPEGGHAEHERVAVPAAEGAGPRGLRHLRLPRRPGRAAGLDAAARAPLLRAASGGRGEREVFSRPAAIRLDLGKPCSRSRTISASCALPPSPQPRASWTTSFPCTSPSPRRPRISRPCASSATGTKRPWSPHTPRHWSRASAGGLTSSTWNRPDSRRSSSSSTATSRTTSATE